MTTGCLLLAGCTAAPDDSAGRAPSGPTHVSVVEVRRSDVRAVTVYEGSAQPRPRVALSSPESGRVAWSVDNTSSVQRGQTVATVNGRPVRSPAAGVVVRSAAGSALRHEALATLEYEGYGLVFTVPAETAYAIHRRPSQALASLRGGASGVDCPVVPVAGAAVSSAQPDPRGASDGAGEGANRVACLLGTDVEAIPGGQGRVGLVTAERKDVLVVPTSAVLGAAQKGEVTRRNADGTFTRTTVALGVSDGESIEVRSGLSEGDVIASVAPAFP